MIRIILVLLVSLFSFSFVFAENENNGDVQEVKNVATSNVLGCFEIDYEDLVLPWTITVTAPPQDIINIEGPCGPNTATWTVSNGNLFITIKPVARVMLSDGGDFYIVIESNSQTLYYVCLTINL